MFKFIYGNDGHDGEVELQFDGVDREMRMPMIYYTRVLPKNIVIKCHRQDRIGFYSFALNPFNVIAIRNCKFFKNI